MRAVAARFVACAAGNVGVAFGFALPVLIGLAGLGVDSATFYNQQTRMQSVADASALAIAKEMRLYLKNPSTLKAAGEARVEALLTEVGLEDRPHTTDVSLSPDDGQAAVRIAMAAKSFLPADVWGENPIVVTANARVYGKERLCVLGLHTSSSDTIKADKGALVTAPDCSIQSNSSDPAGLQATALSTLISSYTCTSGGYKGLPLSFEPLPETDCPPIEDPLADRDPPASGGCDYLDFEVTNGTSSITPGHYCGGLKIVGSAKVTAEPGTYVISGGKLEVGDDARLTGDYVSFYFADDAATLVFKDKAHVELGAPKDGPMAGILFYEDQSAPPGRTFEIASGSVKKLLGTIYLPHGNLKGDNKNVVQSVTNVLGGVTGTLGLGNLLVINEAAAYTVIVANKIELNGVNLIVNADYAGTDVPVPAGVGPNSSAVRLTN